MNLVEEASWTTVLDPQSSGTGTSTTAGVDMQFFTSCVFALVLSQANDGAAISFNVQRATDASFTDVEDVGTTASFTVSGGVAGGLDDSTERGQAMATSGERLMPIPTGTIGAASRAQLMSVYTLSGTKGTLTDEAPTYLLDVTNPPGRFRYLRAKVIRSTASSAIAGVYALRYEAMRKPVAQSSDVEGSLTRPAAV